MKEDKVRERKNTFLKVSKRGHVIGVEMLAACQSEKIDEYIDTQR